MSGATTHKFGYGAGRYMACSCGAEQDLVLRDGNATRLYRLSLSEPWSETIPRCDRFVEPAPAPPVEQPIEPGPTVDLMAVLRAANPGMFEPEIIDGSDVDEAAKIVDLSVAFTPVLERDSLTPVDAVELDGGRYRVFGERPRDVDGGTLKVMRARYLLKRAAIIRRLPTMDPFDRESIERKFWPRGDVPWAPPAGSLLAEQLVTGEPIVIPRDGNGAVDIAAVFNALATPGGKVPEVCPTLPAAGEAP